MAGLKIKVGAALDANANSVFDPLIKSGQRARKQIESDLNAAAKSAGKVAAAGKKAGDKLEQELNASATKILRDEEKSQKRRTAVVEREARERARLEKKASDDAARAVRRQRREDEREARHGLTFGGAIGIGRRAAIRVGRGAAVGWGLGNSTIHGALGLAEGMGLDLSLASHLGNAVDLQQRVVDVTNAGYIPGAAGAQGVKQDTGAVQKDIQSAADYAAFNANEVAEGLQKFVGLTGDLETGRANLQSMAKLARATGADFVSMAEASAEVANHLGNVPDKAAAVDQVMRVIAGQGKMGALEIKDFARQMAKIAANAPAFEGKVTETIGELGLIAQETKLRGGAANAAQAGTAVMNLANDFAKHTTFKNWLGARVYDAKTKKFGGLNPYTDATHTTLRSPEELILEAINYAHGDQQKLKALFPNSRAFAAVRGFNAVYTEASGTHEQKLAAVNAEFERLRHAQLMSEEVTRAFTDAMATGKSKIQLANNKLDELAGTLQGQLLPAAAELAPAIVGISGAIAKAISAISGGPDVANAQDEQKHAMSAQFGALNYLSTLKQFEATNVVQGKGPRSDMMADIAMGRAQPILDAEAAQEKNVQGDIDKYAAKVAKDRKVFEGKSESEIKDYAAGKGLFGYRLKSEAETYLQDKQTLTGLQSSMSDLQQGRTHLLEMLQSGRVTVTVANMPPPAPTPSPFSAPKDGTAPAESENFSHE